MERTYSYTYFGIESNGIIVNGKGLVSNKNGIFEPNEITTLLNIEPFKSHNYGDKRKNGGTIYQFSSWAAEKSSKNRLDVEAQCLETIKNLKSKITILKEIKKKYDVNYVLVVVPHIYSEEKPVIAFNQEIIKFCYLANVEVVVDIYTYQNE